MTDSFVAICIGGFRGRGG